MSFQIGHGAGWAAGAVGISVGIVCTQNNEWISMVLSLALAATVVSWSQMCVALCCAQVRMLQMGHSSMVLMVWSWIVP